MFRPFNKPDRDPLEPAPKPQAAEAPRFLQGEATPGERVVFQFLRDAPFQLAARSRQPVDRHPLDAGLRRFPGSQCGDTLIRWPA